MGTFALEHLRSGDVGKALTAYQQHDRIRTYDRAQQAKAHVVDDWLTARANGTDVIMVASRNADIADLNNLAQRHLVEAGIVHGPARAVVVEIVVETSKRPTRCCSCANDRRLGVHNGMRVTIESVHPMRSVDLTVTTSDRHRIDVPR